MIPLYRKLVVLVKSRLSQLLGDSVRLKVLFGGLTISSLFFLLTFVVFSQEQLDSPIGEVFGTPVPLRWGVHLFRSVVGLFWSGFVFYLLQICHPDSLYQQGKAAFHLQQQKGYGFGRTFFRAYAASEPFRQLYSRICYLIGGITPYLIPIGYQYTPALFLLGWSVLSFLAFFLVREERTTLPEGGYPEYPEDLDCFVQQHIIAKGKHVVVVGVGLGATVGLSTVGNTWVRGYYSYHENTKLSDDKVKIKEMEWKTSENYREGREMELKISENYRRGKELEAKSRWWPWS